MCRAHSSQPLNIFCVTDLKLICGFCATTGEHKGHKFCALKEAYDREKSSFEELVGAVESWKSAEVLSCLEALDESKKKSLHMVSRDAKQVAEYFDKLLLALEHKRSEILSDFETQKLAVMQTYDPEINRLRSALEEQQRALQLAESFRSISEPLTFLHRMQDFREKVRAIRETPLPLYADVEVSILVPCFDVREWDRIRLGDVEALRVPHDSAALRSPMASFLLPYFSRSFWRLVVLLCLCVMSQLSSSRFLASAFTKSVSDINSISFPGPSEMLSWLTGCWHETIGMCALITENCGKCITDFIDTTLEFIS